jgi:hypothetical protein
MSNWLFQRSIRHSSEGKKMKNNKINPLLTSSINTKECILNAFCFFRQISKVQRVFGNSFKRVLFPRIEVDSTAKQ